MKYFTNIFTLLLCQYFAYVSYRSRKPFWMWSFSGFLKPSNLAWVHLTKQNIQAHFLICWIFTIDNCPKIIPRGLSCHLVVLVSSLLNLSKHTARFRGQYFILETTLLCIGTSLEFSITWCEVGDVDMHSTPEEYFLTRILQSPCFFLYTFNLGSGLRVMEPVLW